MTDTHYQPLSDAQYEAIIQAGEMNATASPLRGTANWQALEAASKAADIDGRIALVGCLMEDHFGTDPNGGIALAKVYNFGGIKWAGQPDAYDSGILCPPAEGGTYAGFKDFGGFASELYRTLTNQYCGPFFTVGDLANAWSVYITGRPGAPSGQTRADQLDYYRTKYPPGGPVAVGVYGEDLVAKLRTQIGQPRSGSYDTLNGDHAWAYWCRAAVESTGRNCGLSVTAHASALDAQHAAADQGLLNTTDAPEHGAVVQMDTRFYAPDGHTFLWDDDRKMALGTLTDGTGVGYRSWGPGTYGYAGWYRLPGIVAPRRPVTPPPDPPPATNLVIPDNPYNAGRVAPHEIGVGGGMRRVWEALTAAGVAMQLLGWPVANETQAIVTEPDGRTSKQRTIQRFERATLVFIPENKAPWDIVAALRGQTVTDVPT
jgi:hypothetical protein